MSDLVERLRADDAYLRCDDLMHEASNRIEELERLDREAATVESVICMRTHFTGNPPYVGWKGLGLALTEALDERDKMRARIEELERRAPQQLRDTFAAHAISGLYAAYAMASPPHAETMARWAYDIADAMVEERRRTKC